MMIVPNGRREAAARLAAATRWHGEESPELPALRRDLRAAEVEQALWLLAGEVSTMRLPRLTPAQRKRLRSLIAAL